MSIRDRNPDTPLSWNKSILPTVRVALKPHVVSPALYHGNQYGFASNLPAVTVASIFNKEFKWDSLQIGLGYGGALTIGGSLGELAAGLVLNALVKAKLRENVDFEPELRLRGNIAWGNTRACRIIDLRIHHAVQDILGGTADGNG